MKASLVIKTANGYAVVPYTGSLTADDVSSIKVASKLRSAAWGYDSVLEILEAMLEPVKVTAETQDAA